MSLEAAIDRNTETMKELIAALLSTSKVALNVPPAIDPADIVNGQANQKAKKEPETKKPSDSDTTKTSGEATSNSEPESAAAEATQPAFTFADVQNLVTTLAAPGAYPDGRAKAVAALQRHGLKKFTEEQVKGDQSVIDAVGALLTATIAGEIDPREGA